MKSVLMFWVTPLVALSLSGDAAAPNPSVDR